MKEQTPITPDIFLIYSKIGGCLRNQESDYAVRIVSDLMEQYANAKVLEALEPILKEIQELKKINELMKSDVKLAKSLLEELKQK